MKTIFYIVFFILNSAFLRAQSGTLDNSFGENGKVLNNVFNASCHDVLLQADGKIITAGGGRDDLTQEHGFLIARYNTDGTVDESFGTNGRVILNNFEGATAFDLTSAAIQPDGKILITGMIQNTATYYDIAIIRLNTDGSYDKSFNENGILIKHFDYYDYSNEIYVQSDGKIIIAGILQNRNYEFLSWFVLRYMPDGSIDNSFGDNGTVLTELITSTGVNGILLQPDNKIVVGGSYSSFSRTYTLVRYLSDGKIDSSFGEYGIAKLRPEISDQNYSTLLGIALQEDGKIVATGAGGLNNFRLSVARFNSNGSVDSSFGKNGYTLIPMESGYSKGLTITAVTNKKLIVTGIYIDGDNTGFAAARFKENGVLDSTFGENGLAITGFGNADASAETGIVQVDGNIIVAGTSYPENGPLITQIAMVRFLNDTEKNKYVRIKKWLHRHGFTWQDWPGKNISYYAVQRSSNSSSFTEIARLFNHGNNNQFRYEDAAPLNGDNYYRLAAVSADGSTTYSNIVSIPNNTTAVKIYPNPATNNLQIDGLQAMYKTRVIVIDFYGNTSINSVVTGSSHNLNITQLKKGNYLLKIENNGNVITRKFIKQ